MFKSGFKGDSRRRAERKKYHPGVIVIFNEKAYANTTNPIDWVKQRYSIASAYPLRDNEPRFLSLDAFVPHKNKGQKDLGKECHYSMFRAAVLATCKPSTLLSIRSLSNISRTLKIDGLMTIWTNGIQGSSQLEVVEFY
jgi:hypothetical protein